MNQQESFDRWKIPYFLKDGIVLVDRKHAAKCAEEILGHECHFHGYDAFSVNDQNIQPALEFSRDWSGQAPPSFADLTRELSLHPTTITHYEFVFQER